MQHLHADNPLRKERKERYQERLGRALTEGWTTHTKQDATLEDRALHLLEGFRRGLYLIRRDDFFPDERFGRKHGPFITRTDDNLRRAANAELWRFPLTLKDGTRDERVVPAQIYGMQFGAPSGSRVSYRNMDVCDALHAIESLEKPVVEDGGRVARYHNGIVVRVYDQERQAEVGVSGIPSRTDSDDKAGYTFNGRLQGLPVTNGVWEPGADVLQWDDTVFRWYEVYRGEYVQERDSRTNPNLAKRRRVLGFQGVLGELLAEDWASRVLDAPINTPIHRFGGEVRRHAENIARWLLVDDGEEVREATRQEEEVTLNYVIGSLRHEHTG